MARPVSPTPRQSWERRGGPPAAKDPQPGPGTGHCRLMGPQGNCRGSFSLCHLYPRGLSRATSQEAAGKVVLGAAWGGPAWAGSDGSCTFLEFTLQPPQDAHCACLAAPLLLYPLTPWTVPSCTGQWPGLASLSPGLWLPTPGSRRPVLLCTDPGGCPGPPLRPSPVPPSW